MTAQTMVSYGSAAATGSTAGAAAGNKLNRALDAALGSTSKTMERAASATPEPRAQTKQKAKPSGELIHVTVAQRTDEKKPLARHTAARPGEQAEETAAPVAVASAPSSPQVVTATPEALAAVSSGAGRDTLASLGDPAYKMSIPEDGHLVEVYRYQVNGKDIGTVRLTDGVVTSVQKAQQ